MERTREGQYSTVEHSTLALSTVAQQSSKSGHSDGLLAKDAATVTAVLGSPFPVPGTTGTVCSCSSSYDAMGKHGRYRESVAPKETSTVQKLVRLVGTRTACQSLAAVLPSRTAAPSPSILEALGEF